MLPTVICCFGIVLILTTLWDALQTIVIPKMVERRSSASTVYYKLVWRLWNSVARRLPAGGLRSTSLTTFAPLSLLFLFAVWATLLIVGFALVMQIGGDLGDRSFGERLYFSGVTFFTLGFGDVTATSGLGRLISVLEAGTGFGFLALMIGYFPTFYSTFSLRERFILQMDSRAGSNPSGGEMVRRYAESGTWSDLIQFLREAESWSALQLEAYLSYPILAYYRSQHDAQSWLLSITAILDGCALILAGIDDSTEERKALRFQANATFAMARHVIVDLAYVLGDAPDRRRLSRRSPGVDEALVRIIGSANGSLRPDFLERLSELDGMYEGYLIGLARDLLFTLPSWVVEAEAVDNWRLSAWSSGEHF